MTRGRGSSSSGVKTISATVRRFHTLLLSPFSILRFSSVVSPAGAGRNSLVVTLKASDWQVDVLLTHSSTL